MVVVGVMGVVGLMGVVVVVVLLDDLIHNGNHARDHIYDTIL